MRRLNERGAALMLALSLLLMLAAAGTAAALIARTELLLAAGLRQSSEALAIAQGGLERSIQDLSALADWSAPLSGAPSTFTDGSPNDSRQLPGGEVVVLCCGSGSLTEQLQQRGNGGRSWGADTPQWRLFAWGPASAWRSENVPNPYYVAVWVSDDVKDGDGNPAVDSNGSIVVMALALGPRKARRSVQAAVQRARAEDGMPLARAVAVISRRETRW